MAIEPVFRLLSLVRMKIKNLRKFAQIARLPPSIRRNWRPPLNPSDERALVDSLVSSYFSSSSFGAAEGYLDTQEGRDDLADHLYNLLDNDRITFIPWMASIMSLHSSTVLEIGCGTGASSLAMAEQGARVVGIDISDGSLAVAKQRCLLYGIDDAEFHLANAREIDLAWIAAADVVVFFGCLEHMTLDERLTAISRTWNNLRSGAYLAVVESPNRLWWNDGHTSRLPFFNWLPDDLAIHYSRFSPRAPFNTLLKPPVDGNELVKLTRIGRAFSYHEFELAIPELANVRVWDMNQWMRRGNLIELARWIATGDAGFERQLMRRAPNLNRAYFTQNLNFTLQKP